MKKKLLLGLPFLFHLSLIYAQDLSNIVIQNNETKIDQKLEQEFVTSSTPILNGVQFTPLSPSLTTLMLENSAFTAQSNDQVLISDKTCPSPNLNLMSLPKEDNIPEELKQEGWHVVFEVQFAPTVEKDTKNGTVFSDGFNGSDLVYVDWRLQTNNLGITDVPDKISDFSAFGEQTGIDMENSGNKQGLIFRKVQSAYSQSQELGMSTLKNYSNQMSDDEYMNFLSRVASWVPYNDDRAAFQQKPGAGQGVVTTQNQMAGTMYGVCGDIHSMVSKMAEVRGWEAITVGYALPGGSQHVVSAIVNPNNPDQVNMINYGTMQTNDLNDPNHNPLALSDDWHDIGIGMRLFKNDLGDGKEGQMVQIGNIPTSLGNFFRDLMVKDYQAKEKAFNGDQNFSQNVLTMENVKDKTIEKKNGTEVNKKFQNGISIYEGAVDGAHIWGMAVNHDVFKEISKPDGTLKRLGYSGAGLGTAMVDFNRNSESTASLDTLYVYLNMRGGSIYKLVETPYVKLQGLLGYEVTGFAAFNRESGALESADGNLETFIQLAGEYNKNNTHIRFAGKLDQTVALRNQNLMTDMNANFLQGNINPFLVNAASAEFHFQQNLGPQTALTADAKYTVSRFGNRVSLSTGVIVGGSQFVAGYNGGFTNLRLPGTTTQTNFMTNQGQLMDGLYMGYNGNYNWRTVSGTFNANVGYGVGASNQPFFQVGTKINLGIPPKKKKTIPVLK